MKSAKRLVAEACGERGGCSRELAWKESGCRRLLVLLPAVSARSTNVRVADGTARHHPTLFAGREESRSPLVLE